MAMSPEERAARALVPSTRPNWTYGNNDMPSASAGRNVAPSARPNWTYGSGVPQGAQEVLDPAPGASRATPRTPPAAPVTDAVRADKAYKAGQAVNKGLKAVGPLAKVAGAAGVVSNFNDYKIADEEVDSSAMGTLRYLRDGEFGKVADSLSKGAVETLADIGSFAANTADVFVPGEPVSARYNQFMRDKFGSQLVDKSGNGPSATPPATQSQVRAAEPQTPAAQAPQAAPGQPQANLGVVTVKNGNDFSGTNVKEGFSYEGQLRRMPGAPIGSVPTAGITAALNGGGGGFSSTLPRSNDAIFGDMEQRGIEQRRLEGLVAEQRAAGARPAPPMSLNDALLRMPTRSISEDLRAKTDGTYDELQLADAKTRGDLIKTFMGADAQRYGSELQAQSASENAAVADRNGLRNFQASIYNTEQQGRSAAAKNRMDAFYKEREFQTNQENKAFEKSIAANKDMQSRLEARFRTRDPETGADVVDTQRIAAFSRAVDATLPAFIKMLEQTNTPQSKAMAQKLSSERAAGLDPTSFDQLARLFDKRELARNSTGIAYGSSSFVDSDNLLDYLTQTTEQTMFDPTEVTANGTRIRQSKLTYGPDGNVVLPNWFESPSTNLRDLRQER